MKKRDLTVFFHATASAQRAETLRALQENAVAIPVIIQQSIASDTITLFPDQEIHSCAMHVENLNQALDIMKASSSKEKPVVLITLCEEMMRAANARDIRIVTIGAPNAEIARGYYPAKASFLSDMLNTISKERAYHKDFLDCAP